MDIFTIGHSTRKLEELIEILSRFHIEVLIDVRHFPHSRHNPQFNKETLEIKLPEAGIQYVWLKELGGFRKEGYLAYMKTKEFRAGLKKIIELAKQKRVCLMCAEILWFKCHRKFISDKLVESGVEVIHLFNKEKEEKHFHLEGKIRCEKNRVSKKLVASN